jgi:hypothetical protein
VPSKPSWVKRIPQIRSAVERLDAPFVDRRGIETLFRLRSRQAVKLLRLLAGYQVGNALVVSREGLLRFLVATEKGDLYRAEELRSVRVKEALEEARLEANARKVRFTVAANLGASLADLPPSVKLAAGELHVTFKDSKDLLQQLYQLSRAIGRDFTAFERLLGVVR